MASEILRIPKFSRGKSPEPPQTVNFNSQVPMLWNVRNWLRRENHFSLSKDSISFLWEMSDCRIRISDSRRRIVGLAILSDSDSDRIGILSSDSDSDFGLNPSGRIDEKLISDPTGNTKSCPWKLLHL